MANELDDKSKVDGAHSADDLVNQAVEKVHTHTTTPVAPSGAAGEQLYEAQVEGEEDTKSAAPAESDVINIEDLTVDPDAMNTTEGGTPWDRLLPIEEYEDLDLADAEETEPERESQEDLCRDTRLFTNDISETYSFFKPTLDMFQRGHTEVGLTRRYSLKAIDEVWVTVIEDSLTALEYVVRHPSVYIEENEEIKPIEQSRHITQKSTRHLAQHTNFISKVEGDEVTPNKILNITRDETMLTYENRFVVTLTNGFDSFCHLLVHGREEFLLFTLDILLSGLIEELDALLHLLDFLLTDLFDSVRHGCLLSLVVLYFLLDFLVHGSQLVLVLTLDGIHLQLDLCYFGHLREEFLSTDVTKFLCAGDHRKSQHDCNNNLFHF